MPVVGNWNVSKPKFLNFCVKLIPHHIVLFFKKCKNSSFINRVSGVGGVWKCKHEEDSSLFLCSFLDLFLASVCSWRIWQLLLTNLFFWIHFRNEDKSQHIYDMRAQPSHAHFPLLQRRCCWCVIMSLFVFIY